MVQLQILNKVINEGDIHLITDHNLDVSYFPEYEMEFRFLMDYYHKYKTIPSRETFISKFADFQVLEVRDSNEYLLETIREENLFNKSLPVMKKVSELMKTNAVEAFNFLRGKLPELVMATDGGAVDLIKDASIRATSLEERATADTPSSISTGLPELDKSLGGWMRGEELVTVVARTGEGKTWLLVFFMVEAWKQGYTVGIYSGEMSAEKIGYRFDTILNHYSNSQLIKGTIPKLGEYMKYIEELKGRNLKPFWVITPKDLGGRATVSQLEAFIDNYHLDILGVDQYSLMRDERGSRYADTREQLEHISTDLFELSIKKHIPIIALSQANRMGAKQEGEKGTPDIDTIYGADAIGQNSTKIISFRQTGPGVEISIKKNRDGKRGDKFLYNWDYDNGTLQYIPSADNPADESQMSRNKEHYKDSGDVF